MPLKKIMYAGIYLKVKEKHTTWSKQKSIDQSCIAMQASHGLEGPQVKQTVSTQLGTSIIGTRSHLSKTEPKLK
jgi:hypothetical protein